MLAKLIAYGADREQARLQLLAGLRDFAVLGVTTNIPYLVRILEHPAFANSDFHTQFLEQNPSYFARQVSTSHEELAAALAGAYGARGTAVSARSARDNGSGGAAVVDAWSSLGAWRNTP
jgi:acetyl/propionyl-CoA carboxylase alpha subunit